MKSIWANACKLIVRNHPSLFFIFALYSEHKVKQPLHVLFPHTVVISSHQSSFAHTRSQGRMLIAVGFQQPNRAGVRQIMTNQGSHYHNAPISQLPIAVMVLNADDTPLYVNPKFTDLYGYDLKDIATPQMWLERAYPNPDYREQVSNAWRQALTGESPRPDRPYEYAVTCKDGRIRHTRFRVAVLDDGTRWVAMDDITELVESQEALQQARRELEAQVADRTNELENRIEEAARENRWRARVENALRQSEAQYRILVQTSPDSIIALDNDKRIMMCNHRAVELFGYNHRAELLGRPSSILYGPEVKKEMAQQRSRLEAKGHITGIEMWMRRKDGSRFYAEFSVSLITGPQGERLGYVGFARDVTERKRAEDAIRQRNFELRVLNKVTTAIIQSQQALEPLLDVALSQTLETLDLRTGWVSLKQTESGKKRQPIQILKGALEDGRLLYEPGRTLRKRAFDRVSKTHKVVLESDIPLCADMRDTPVLCSVGYVPLTRDTDVIGVLGVLSIHQKAPNRLTSQDIHLLRAISNQISLAVKHTQLSREAAEAAQLRELDRIRSELIANFSHSLRSPLGIIAMSCSTLLREDVALDDRTRRDLLEDIKVETGHLTHIVNGILDLGHLQSKDLELISDLISVKSVITRAVERMSANNSSHPIQVVNAATRFEMIGDAKRLEEVVVNLLDNAVKYSPQGGEIRVSLRNPDSHQIRIEVADRGIGIPKSELETVFERFYRVNNETTRQTSGNGLGLAICRAVIEAHEGHIWAESKLGQGTTVFVTLPLTS